MAFTPTPDPAAKELTTSGALTEPAVSFRGYLSPRVPDTNAGVYRLFTSLWFDEWLEIKSIDVLYQIPGSTEDAAGQPNIQLADGASLVWVKKRANISKCRMAEACEIAEQDQAEASEDPTMAYPTAARPKPKYP